MNMSGENTRIEFPFATPTPAAVFRRSETLSDGVRQRAPKIDLAALTRGLNSVVRKATCYARRRHGEGIDAPAPGAPANGERGRRRSWLRSSPIGDTVTAADRGAGHRPHRATARARLRSSFRSTMRVQFTPSPTPDLGDRLMVVTALAPARGFLKGAGFRRTAHAAIDRMASLSAADRRRVSTASIEAGQGH